MAEPEDFVARDKARGIAWRLERVLQERRLAWRGADVGMVALADQAAETLEEIAADAREASRRARAGLLRDRERPHLVLPFAVAAGTVAWRVEQAARIEAARRAGVTAGASTRPTPSPTSPTSPTPPASPTPPPSLTPPPRAEAVVAGLLEDALVRLGAFQSAWDAKRALADPRPTDLGALVARLEERLGAAARVLGEPAPAGPPADAPLPSLASDPRGLEDLLLLARLAVPGAPGWGVVPARPGRALRLSLAPFPPRGEAAEVPEEVDLAARVLAWLHPVQVSCEAGGLVVELADPVGEGLAAAVHAATGGEAVLDPEAEAAVRRLLAAPEPDAHGGVPPARLVALLGLLRTLDAALARTVEPRLLAPGLRRAAAALPREATRKAPLRRALVQALEREIEGLPVHRLDGLAEALARGRALSRPLAPAEAAVLLAAFGRRHALAGVTLERSLDLAPLTDAEVLALATDLADLAAVRRDLEAGRPVAAALLTRLERAGVAALGRLGRVARGA